MSPRPKAPGTKPEGAESSNPKQAGSGSGEERTWTIRKNAVVYDAPVDSVHASILGPNTQPVEVVEASAWRAEREAREKLSEALRQGELAVMDALTVMDPETAKQYRCESSAYNEFKASLSAVPVQKEER